MDRQIVYTGAIPQTTDILNTNKMGQVGLGFALRGILGVNTVVHNLACIPTVPASLQVSVGSGAIYTLDTLDATAYSDLGLDQHQIIKQGILQDAVLLTITPPGSPGQSQVYLVQAILSDIDSGSSVLPYYNATNPSQPFSGPGNSGMSQYSTRTVACTIALKQGTAAATGSQVTPSPDAGYTGLYAVTVANGQTQLTTTNIVLLPTAPFFPTLPAVPNDVQTNTWIYCVDTGTQNAMVGTVYPPITSLVPGTGVLIKAAFSNNAVATLNLNGTGAQAIHRATGANLSSGDYTAGELIALVWDGAAWQMLNFIGATSGGVVNNFNSINIPFAVDSGSINAMTGLFSPALTSLVAGQFIEIQCSNTNTGDSTITCNVLAAKGIRQNGNVLQPRALVAGQILAMIYDGTFFQIVNARWPYLAFDTASPPGTDISMAVGDQVNITFTNALSVPLKIASVPGVYQIDAVLTKCNCRDAEAWLMANNTIYGSGQKFWGWSMNVVGDLAMANMAGSTIAVNSPLVTGYTSDLVGSGGVFWADLFYDQEDINGFLYSTMGAQAFNQGPMILTMKCSTFATAKMVHWGGGINGGPVVAFSRWYDTSTAWNSLGTFGIAEGFIAEAGGGNLGTAGSAISISGSLIVKRLA
jgi:hypothetical protein